MTLNQIPFLDELIVQIMPDSQARTLALDAGDIDVARGSPADINSPEVAVVSYDTTGFLFYTYHLDRDETSFCQDQAVRGALFVALDWTRRAGRSPAATACARRTGNG